MRSSAIALVALLVLSSLGFAASSFGSGTPTFGTPTFVSNDGQEPIVKVDSVGTVYIGMTAGLPVQSPIFRSQNGGASFSRLPNLPSTPIVTVSGGTTAIGAEPDLALAPDDTLYVSDLTLANTWVYAYGDHGATLKSQVPWGETTAVVDRQWITVGDAAKTSAADAGWELFSTTNDLERGLNEYWSPDGGILPAAFLGEASGTGVNPNPGEPVVYDPVTKNTYTPFEDGSGNLRIAVMHSPTARQTPVTPSYFTIAHVGDGQNQFVVPALDKAGNVYVIWSAASTGTNVDVFVSVSTDHGNHWKTPVQLSSGGDNVYPWIVAGQAGHIDAVWYGASTGGNPETNTGPWHVQFAQSLDMLSAAPTHTLVTLPDVVQSGFGICLSGTGCSLSATGSRALGDFFEVTADSAGVAHIAFDKAVGGNPVGVFYVKQTSGTTI